MEPERGARVNYKRLFAHLFVDELPDDALAEILEFLANAWLFYQPTALALEQTGKKLRGKVTRRYERPSYTIEE